MTWWSIYIKRSVCQEDCLLSWMISWLNISGISFLEVSWNINQSAIRTLSVIDQSEARVISPRSHDVRAHGLLPHDAGEGPRLGSTRVWEHLRAEPEYAHVVPRLNLRGPEVIWSLINSEYNQIYQSLMPVYCLNFAMLFIMGGSGERMKGDNDQAVLELLNANAGWKIAQFGEGRSC